MQRAVVEADAVGGARIVRRVAVARARRLGQVDDVDDLVVQERRRLRVAVALPARGLAQRRAQPVQLGPGLALGEAVDEVDGQHARLHQADAIVVGDQPGVRVRAALGVGPDEFAGHGSQEASTM